MILDLDFGWIDYHIDHPHCYALDIALDLGYGRVAGLDLVDEMEVLVAQQVVDHCWGRSEYLAFSLQKVGVD